MAPLSPVRRFQSWNNLIEAWMQARPQGACIKPWGGYPLLQAISL
jgi:hypothetical protein